MLLMETKQFNFVCANVCSGKVLPEEKFVCERKNSDFLSNILVLLGGKTWGVLMGQVPEQCRRILHGLLGEREFLLIK